MTWLGTAPVWQEPAPAADAATSNEQRVSAAIRVLKSRKSEWFEKEGAMGSLMELGPEGQESLVLHLSRQLKKMESTHWRNRGALEKDFRLASARLAQGRLGKKGTLRLEAARGSLLRASRDKGLTKAMVKTICDPAVAAIVGILEITVLNVLDEEEDITTLLDSIEDTLEDHRLLHDYWIEAHGALLMAEGKWQKRAEKRTPPADPGRHLEEMWGILHALAFEAEIMPPRDRGTLAFNEALFEQLQPGEAAGIRKLNILRIRAGIGAMRVDVKLCAAGRGHSKDMVEGGFFAHQSPVEGKKTPSARARLAGTSGGAENIAAGMDSGPGAIRAWWYSPGHHRNMMGNHGRTGLGRFESHWTQMFGK